MDTTEIWKPINLGGVEVEVSNLGSVRTLDRITETYGRARAGKPQGTFTQRRPGKILRPYVARNGYREVSILFSGKRTKYRVHRLVAQAFVAGHFDEAVVDHIDGDKLNNCADNLEWVTRSENTKRQWDIGLVDLRGELGPSAKITNLQANAIAVLIERDFPVSEVAKWFGVSEALVYKIKQGRRHL
jgi:hypothetical protein